MDIKGLLPLGAAVGAGYLGYQKKFLKKNAVLSAAVASAGAYLVGKWLADKFMAAPPPPQVNPGQQGYGEYLPEHATQHMLLTDSLPSRPVSAHDAPAPPGRSATAGMHPSQYADYMADKLTVEATGSLGDGGDGLGSLAPQQGFSDAAIDAMFDDGDDYGSNGVN